jgi:O-acetylhomoserine (thiol)-lyase
MKDQTLAIHAGFKADSATNAVAVPIYQTVAYAFDSAQHGADLFNLAVPGNIYTRIMNPTTDVLEQRCAALEGGIAGLGVSAGSAAINYSVLNIAEQGNNIVTVPLLYGGTYTLFKHMLPRQGIEVRFAADDSVEAMQKLIDDKTTAVFCESIGNPAGNIVDIEALATMAHAHGVPLIVDNTVATPYLVQPLKWGADIVVHSATKYLGGHDDVLAGVVVCGNEEDHARLLEHRTQTGPMASADTAWLLLRGLETLEVRVARQTATAQAIAERLRTHEAVSVVRYPGFGGLLSFDVADAESARRVETATRLVVNSTSLGGVTSRIEARSRWEGERVPAGLLRLSVGLEDPDAIWADLAQALGKA